MQARNAGNADNGAVTCSSIVDETNGLYRSGRHVRVTCRAPIQFFTRLLRLLDTTPKVEATFLASSEPPSQVWLHSTRFSSLHPDTLLPSATLLDLYLSLSVQIMILCRYTRVLARCISETTAMSGEFFFNNALVCDIQHCCLENVRSLAIQHRARYDSRAVTRQHLEHHDLGDA